MAGTPICNFLCAVVWMVSIAFGWYFYSLCQESHFVLSQQVNWYLGVLLFSTVAGIIIQLLECCINSPGTEEKFMDCIYGCATVFSNMPIVIISLVTFEYMPPEVCQSPTIDRIIKAVDFNAVLHLPPLLYRLSRCCNHECSFYFTILHLLGLIFVGVIILHSIGCIYMWLLTGM